MKKVVVECNPDELLVRVLGLGRKEIVHEPNKGEVCNYLRKNNIRLAIIDEDPDSGQPNYLKDFVLKEEKFGVKKLVRNPFDKTILVIKPRLEEWVIAQCTSSHVDPRKFHLPNDAKELKKVINSKLVFFGNLLEELLLKENKGLLYIKNVIQEIYK
jgi:hypothetical protein